MSTVPLYPLRFVPILRRLIWGGRRLGTVLHKPIGDETDYAESWELSDYHESVSVVHEGDLAGTTLRQLVHSRGEALLGPALGPRDQFPLLVKYIDAHQVLSVQVHPDDETGKRLAGDNGKTETWLILDAEPGSAIYAGLKQGVGRVELAKAIQSGQVEHVLHRFMAKPGDCILIEAGTVHAIGAGVLLAEIQEMSDATFRIDDWGRLGADGKPRPLHIRQAMESIDFSRGPVNPITPQVESIEGGGTRERLSRSSYFALDRLRLKQSTTVGQDDRFTILMGVGGCFELVHGGKSVVLDFGRTVLLPATLGPCQVLPRGDATVLTCVVP
jgi:mannose-6-phosphate isomerase